MMRACALKGGEWLEAKGLLNRRVNDLQMQDLEGVTVAIVSEFVRQLALEGRKAEAEVAPELHFTA